MSDNTHSLIRVNDRLALQNGVPMPSSLMDLQTLGRFVMLCRSEAFLTCSKLALFKWWPSLERESGQMVLNGVDVREPLGGSRLLVSAPICERLCSRELVDTAGVRVVLSRAVLSDAVVPAFVLSSFRDGVPASWRQVVSEWRQYAGIVGNASAPIVNSQPATAVLNTALTPLASSGIGSKRKRTIPKAITAGDDHLPSESAKYDGVADRAVKRKLKNDNVCLPPRDVNVERRDLFCSPVTAQTKKNKKGHRMNVDEIVVNKPVDSSISSLSVNTTSMSNKSRKKLTDKFMSPAEEIKAKLTDPKSDHKLDDEEIARIIANSPFVLLIKLDLKADKFEAAQTDDNSFDTMVRTTDNFNPNTTSCNTEKAISKEKKSVMSQKSRKSIDKAIKKSKLLEKHVAPTQLHESPTQRCTTESQKVNHTISSDKKAKSKNVKSKNITSLSKTEIDLIIANSPYVLLHRISTGHSIAPDLVPIPDRHTAPNTNSSSNIGKFGKSKILQSVPANSKSAKNKSTTNSHTDKYGVPAKKSKKNKQTDQSVESKKSKTNKNSKKLRLASVVADDKENMITTQPIGEKSKKRPIVSQPSFFDTNIPLSDDLFAARVVGGTGGALGLLNMGGGEVNAVITPKHAHSRSHASITPLGVVFGGVASGGAITPHCNSGSDADDDLLVASDQEDSQRYVKARRRNFHRPQGMKQRLTAAAAPLVFGTATPRGRERAVNRMTKHIESITYVDDDSGLSDDFVL